VLYKLGEHEDMKITELSNLDIVGVIGGCNCYCRPSGIGFFLKVILAPAYTYKFIGVQPNAGECDISCHAIGMTLLRCS